MSFSDQERLLFAVPKKGRLYERVLKVLAGAGLAYTRQPRLDLAQVQGMDISLVFLPAHDIAEYVAEGRCDMGITGQDIIEEAECKNKVKTLLEFGFGKCRLCLQGPKGKYTSPEELSGKRVVTSFPAITKKFFDEIDAKTGKTTTIKYVTGSVEVACALDIADGIVDLVETGTTMKAAGLEVVHSIMDSQTVLICKDKYLVNKVTSASESNADKWIEDIIRVIRNRVEGYLTSTKHCMISYNIHKNNLPEAIKVTPGHESPTIAELKDSDWKSVSSLVNKKSVSEIMDKLAAIGARSILVFNLDNCRFPNENK